MLTQQKALVPLPLGNWNNWRRRVGGNVSSEVKEDDASEVNNVVNEFTKADYVGELKNHRRDFAHVYFANDLKRIFEDLRDMACAGKECCADISNSVEGSIGTRAVYTAVFNVPEHFDVFKTEVKLKGYFEDLGYYTSLQPSQLGGDVSFALSLSPPLGSSTTSRSQKTL